MVRNEVACTRGARRSRALEGTGFAALYILSTTAEVSLIKALNYKEDVVLPIFTAIVLNQAWLVMVPSYVVTRRAAAVKDAKHAPLPQPTASSLAKAYALMGLTVYAVTMSRNYAVNLLPGSVAALLMASSMAWSIALSKLLLKRSFKAAHYAAAGVGVASILALGADAVLGWDPEEGEASSPARPPGMPKGAALATGLAAGALSGFFIALMSVLSSIITKAWGTHRNLRVTEMTLVSSLLAVLLLLPTGWAVGEYTSWPSQLRPGAGGTSAGRRTALLLLCLAMPLNKAVVRSTKYATIAATSPFFFEFVQATAGIAASLANILLFQERVSWGLGVSVGLMSCASALYVLARRQEEGDRRRAQEDAEETAAEEGERATEEEGVLLPLPSPRGPRVYILRVEGKKRGGGGGGASPADTTVPLLQQEARDRPPSLPEPLDLPGVTAAGALGPAADLTSPPSSRGEGEGEG